MAQELGIAETDPSHDVDGWLVGGQVGCQMQQDRWVFGIEGQASWADIDGNSVLGSPTSFRFKSKTDIVGTITLRLGYAIDRTLFYAKGGPLSPRTSTGKTSWSTACLSRPM